MTAAFQGFGNVAQHAVRWFTQAGGMAVCVSCWDGRDNASYSGFGMRARLRAGMKRLHLCAESC